MTPKAAYDNTSARARALLTLHDAPPAMPAVMPDLLRSAVVVLVSALDRYVHERAIKGVVGALRRKNLSREQKDFTIPAYIAVRVAEAVSAARNAPQQIRPANVIRKHIQGLLHKRPFQSWREIEFAFELIGIGGLAGQLQAAYAVANFQPVKDQLNKIIERRNHIVHEGDLVRHERGGRVRVRPISRQFVADSLDFIDDLVAKLENVA